MIRFRRRFGPRSVIVTTTDSPFFTFTTRIVVPSGKYQLAAVSLWQSNGWPFAIFLPCRSAPYQEAVPMYTIFNFLALACTFVPWDAADIGVIPSRLAT